MFMLNERAWRLLYQLVEREEELKVKVSRSSKGALLVDAGVECLGSLEAGILISEMLLSGLGEVKIIYSDGLPHVQVITDHPLSKAAFLSSSLCQPLPELTIANFIFQRACELILY